jgi:phosphoribosylformylglycinamidine synthase
MSVDGNGRYCYLDPFRGAALAVAEACRNVACTGARPLGATNCLNFGNPERPGTMWQFAKAVEGIGAACRALGVPITGGNVSLYNETDGRAIHPTPVIGVVGLLEHMNRLVTTRFRAVGDVVILLGASSAELGASEYLNSVHGLVKGLPPEIDLEGERALHELLADLADARLLRSAHDCSDGGFAVALAESCFGTGSGADVVIDPVVVASVVHVNDAAALFGEAPSRVIASAAAADVPAVLARAERRGVPAHVVGKVGGSHLRISIDGRPVVDLPVEQAERVWSTALENWFGRRAA